MVARGWARHGWRASSLAIGVLVLTPPLAQAQSTAGPFGFATAFAPPTLVTDASDDTSLGPAAVALTDTVTVVGRIGADGSGMIDFKLFGPDDLNCSGPAIDQFNVPYPMADNSPVTSVPFPPTKAGTYRWKVTYSGDPDNMGAESLCDPANQTIVAKATPALSTTASPAITLGAAGALTDSATVSGQVSPQSGATIDFSLYGPDDATCAAAAIFTSSGVPYSPKSSAVSSAPFVPTAPGTYRWVASYSGDANNNSASGACNDANESTLVSAAITIPPVGPPDPDGDGLVVDNCPDVANADQLDADGDGVGNACEVGLSGKLAPVAGTRVKLSVTSGEVFVKLPATASTRAAGPDPGSGFISLKGVSNVPVGSTVDARAGTLSVTAAASTGPRPRTVSGRMSAAVFLIKQRKARRATRTRKATRPYVDLQLTHDSAMLAAARCRRPGPAGAGTGIVRRLSGSSTKGLFRTVGAAATVVVENATWNVVDRCDGTVTQVGRGRVTLIDRIRKRTIRLRAGQAYRVRANFLVQQSIKGITR